MSADIPRIVVYLEGREVQTVDLTATVLTIGRTPDNTLALPHPLVARRHAELRISGGAVVITDLGGTAGTSVGGDRLLPNQPRQLGDGDTMRIGPFTLLVRGPRDQEEPAPEGAEAVPPAPVEPAPVVAATPPALGEPRPSFPAPRAVGPVSGYIYDLPSVYHANQFLGRFLQIFESLWEPLEQRQSHIQMYFDPRTCPVDFLPWLAGWLSLPLNPEWPEPRKRTLLTEAFELYRWRGTRYGLSRIIELSTGLAPEILDEPSLHAVIRIKLTVAADSAFDRHALEDVINAHKPAHVGYIIDLQRTA